ncbi:RING finger protein 17-like isoform X2 [Melanaphis sacchari]|uniref:RING finger protein 17-like isoform X2 n=1 Tax=Melanaphis sacchari TaxID=742174 RepID=UPI000DC13BF4|nr:RING finger protein 17-like isoform X2 [Melanaphis sacchari]
MNRTNKIPFCSRCHTNYHIGDVNGSKVPMLLACGHDMCRSCIKFMFRKKKQVICEICKTDSTIKCDDELTNIPIHYFLVGKVWHLSHNRKLKIHQDISNLRMTDLPSESLNKIEENCQTCQKYADFFCQQCNEVYCKDCCQEIHFENQIMLQHDLKKLDTTHLKFLQASKCDLHLKLIDFICITCDRQMCSICAIDNHRHHDVQDLKKYNMSQIQSLNEYLLKGDILLKKLKHYRDKFNDKVKKYRCHNLKKNKSFDHIKRLLSTYVSSVIGAFQCFEQQLFNVMDQAEESSANSMIQIVDQLNSFIEKLQTKLNIVDVLLKNNQYSSNAIMDYISDIKCMLDTTYYLAKKSITKPSIKFNFNIFNTIQQSVNFNIDLSDRYVLGCSPHFLPEYTLTAMIGLNSDDNSLAERPPSSVSSMLSCYSNYSAFSGNTTSASGDAAASSNDATTNSDNAFAASDSISTSIVDSPPQSQVIKEIVRSKIEPVIVSHINSPSDFYLQLVANKAVLYMVDDNVNKHVKSEDGAVPVDHVEMDNTVYAVQTSTNEWHRGVVLHSYNEDGKDLFRVHFIDYGFMEILTADRIRSVPSSVVSIPSLAYNCAFYDLKPKSTTGWSNEAYILFSDLMLVKTGSFFVYPLNLNGQRIEVDVVWKEENYPLSIRDAMFFLGFGSYEYYVNKTLHEQLVKMITLPDSLKLEEKERYPVVLCHVISPTEFYLRTTDDTAQLEEVMDALKTIYTPTAKNTHKSYLLYTPQIGMAVAARYSLDGVWYRAKITSLPESRLVTVFYIDFGNSETLPWNELRVLDKELIKTPPLAIKASLADVYPAVDGIESTKWSDNAYAAFLKFSKIDYAEDNLIAFIHEVDGDTHKIVLYNHTSRTEFCLNSQLVSQGYATTVDPGLCVFKKKNIRKQMKLPVLHVNCRNKEVILPNDDPLSFIKQRSVTENENHDWKNKDNKKKFPGVPMTIIKVVSPDEIILKKMNYNTEKLTGNMNKVYANKKKKTQKLVWKINDLCAIFINKYGNWYRGKILNIDLIKQLVTVYLYDLNETIDKISIKSLHILEENCAKEKCGILHCGLYNLVPLGASNGIWPKFTCDRLIEKLKKYPLVYFSRMNAKEQDIALGDIWVREIKMPRALEPLHERWISMSRFMIEQGFALNNKQDKKDGGYSDSQSESEFNYSIETIENDKFVNCWLPPACLDKSEFNAVVTNVDMECHIYLQNMDNETPQLLQLVSNELNEMFSNSQPEPFNMQWSEGQSVIVQYHLDNMWYRGTILKKDENGEFSVLFNDYGNVETCTHEKLRSTLYMTDVPQLCVKGYFSTILPITKSGKWPLPSLDFIHYLLVGKTCKITIDKSLTTDDIYAIKFMKEIQDHIDVCQYLVTNKFAFFEYVSSSIIDLVPDDENNFHATDDSNYDDYGQTNDDSEQTNGDGGQTNGDGGQTNGDGGQTNDDDGQTYVEYESIFDNATMMTTYSVDDEQGNNVSTLNTSAVMLDDGEESDYLKFCLEVNEVIEGTMCRINGPTSFTLMITKIGGADFSVAKNQMYNMIYDKCGTLPPLDHVVPGRAVVVFHNGLWKRGIIENGGNSVLLVDFGISIKLIKKNLRPCPAELFQFPMFTIDCQLVNVRLGDDAYAKDVVDKLSKTLRGINLKIVGIVRRRY